MEQILTDIARITAVKYRVLGPLTVSVDGQDQLSLGGRRQRTVLALLLANPNRVLSQDSMVEQVWAGQPPEKGVRTLHTYISNLRRVVGAISREGDGYILRVHDDEVDAQVFEDLATEARSRADSDPEVASRLLSEALALWTGSPFGDLQFEQGLIVEANRLSEARVDAQELRAEIDLDLGVHHDVVSELQAMVEEHPYRERVVGLLMLALYREGRQAEALRVYARARERLADELGIDPSSELQELELRILNQDPDLASIPATRTRKTTTRAARGYELHDLIGTTDLGNRYRGFQSSIGREVSVLAIERDSIREPRFIQRFESEMQMVSRFEHPNLVPVFDFWREPEQAFVVTPYYRGGSLATALVERTWGLAAALKLADQVADALSYLHRQGTIHGALEPSRVLLDDDLNAYLADTGVSALLGSAQGSVASDVQALGSLLFQTLTGEEPLGQQSLKARQPELPTELDHALARALHPDPDSRYERVVDLVRALRRSVGMDVLAAPTPEVQPEHRNPYKGLRAFQEPDAHDFHGRDTLVGELVEATARARMVTVVGPSGSGKSSAVRAGLIPQLRIGVVPGSSSWLITDMFPGAHPYDELERALLRVAAHRPPHLQEALRSDERGLIRAVKEIAPTDESEVIIVIDQFEELFSMSSSKADRQSLLDLLATAATADESRVRLVLTLRADFFDRPLEYPKFAEVMRSSIVTLSPPTADGLARAVSQPALDSGVGLEPGLVNRVVDDVRQEPGGLPLLQYAMTELYASSQGDILTLESYERIGGVAGAVAQRAEEIYADLSSSGKEAARQLFLRLVSVDEVADDTRRRVLQTELMSLDVDRSVMSSVIQNFGAFRLLSFDQDAVSRTPTVELAHEALLREWDRLGAWIDERREDLLLHRRISVLVRDWRANDNDPSFLLRGGRLEQALTWQERTDIAISSDETEYLSASVEVEEQERTEREQLEAKATRRRTAAIALLAGGLVVAVVLGLYALAQRQEAATNAALATAREISSAAIAAAEDDPELGILLALEALDTVEDAGTEPIPEVLSALWDTFTKHRVELTISGAGFFVSEFSPDGSVLATDMESDRSVVVLWDPETGERIGRLTAPKTDSVGVADVDFSADGNLIYVTRFWNPLGTDSVDAVDVYDATTYEKIGALVGPRLDYVGIDVATNGNVTAVLFGARAGLRDRPQTLLWEFNQPSSPIVLDGFGFGFLSDGASVLLGVPHETSWSFAAVDWATGREAWAFDVPLDGVPVLSPTGSHLAAAGPNGTFAVYDLETRRQVWRADQISDDVFVWSQDGSRIAFSGNSADITIVDAATGAVSLVLTGHDASVYSVAWHPSGDQLASVEFDNEEVRIWDVTPTGLEEAGFLEIGGNYGELRMLPDGSGFVRSDVGTKAEIFDLDGVRTATFDDLDPGFPAFASVSGDLSTLASPKSDDSGVVIDIDTGEETTLPCLAPLAISDDGSLVAAVRIGRPHCADVESGLYVVESGMLLDDVDGESLAYADFSGVTAFDGQEYSALVFGGGVNDSSYIEIWSVEPLERLATVDDSVIGTVLFLFPRFSQDGRYLGVGSNSGRLIVIDMERLVAGVAPDEFIVFNHEAHNAPAPRAIPSTNGLVVTGGLDSKYRMWDLETGARLFEINAEGLSFLSFGFSADGSTMYYMHTDQIVGQVPTDPYELIERVRSSVTRGLTDDECREFLHQDTCP